jgi:hypothetical protein
MLTAVYIRRKPSSSSCIEGEDHRPTALDRLGRQRVLLTRREGRLAPIVTGMDSAAQVAPRSERPHMPEGYGIRVDEDGQLPWNWAEERLAASRNYWIATTSPDSSPHLVPVWGVWLDGAVCFGTDRMSRKARNLVARPAVVVHLESGDEVVILHGVAEEVADPDALRRIDTAYEAKFGMAVTGAPGEVVVYAVRPRIALGWQERSFNTNATRWVFSRP